MSPSTELFRCTISHSADQEHDRALKRERKVMKRIAATMDVLMKTTPCKNCTGIEWAHNWTTKHGNTLTCNACEAAYRYHNGNVGERIV